MRQRESIELFIIEESFVHDEFIEKFVNDSSAANRPILLQREKLDTYIKKHTFGGTGNIFKSWGVEDARNVVEFYNNPQQKIIEYATQQQQILSDLSSNLIHNRVKAK